ncbi:hypothetical protein [uncultured Chryseobacterium sp.]|uniref:hypothetical protein n=1 Tax=uncultured Chryseobacterium sp. TaxID=259322 RepID=UPI0025850BF0|nr:hypothetical protein [uncultured Chryseobacterium sp.]
MSNAKRIKKRENELHRKNFIKPLRYILKIDTRPLCKALKELSEAIENVVRSIKVS